MTIHELKAKPMTKIAASIEVAARQAIDSQDLPGLFPEGTRVYITDMGTDGVDTLTAAAKRIHDLGYKPVPHFASRRLGTRAALETRIRRAAEEAGVTDVLVIGGGLERQAGEFSSTMEVLETGFFDKYGITEMGVAGHPEGSPEFSEAVALEALRLKKNFGERTGARLRVVTQFGFDAERFIRYAESLREHVYFWMNASFNAMRMHELKMHQHVVMSESPFLWIDMATLQDVGTAPWLFNLYINPKEDYTVGHRMSAWLATMGAEMREHGATFVRFPPKNIGL